MTWFSSPADAASRLHDAGYLADPATATTAYLAGALEKPLLVEGPAGVGKTELAKAVGRATGAELVRLQCYEGLDEARALYEWNYKKQLLRIQASGGDASWDETHDDIFTDEFLLTRPLLTAIRREEQTVLLVDEVDKTDVEVEGLLLEVLSDFQVTIPELGTLAAVRRPLVVLTSNATRELSEALKRRCLYLHLDYPDADREREIVTSQVPELDKQVVDSLVDVVHRLRELELKKAPSIAESVDWARTLVALEIRDLDPKAVSDTLGVILKHSSDHARALEGAEVLRDEQRLVDRHISFLEALRGAGMSVSLAEGLDAVEALRVLPWDQRETVRTAYAASLIKKQAQRPTFDTLFDLYFPRLVGEGVGRRARRRPTTVRDNAQALSRFRAELCRRWATGTSRRCRTSRSRRSAASVRCPGAGRACRRGRRTPRCSGSRRRDLVDQIVASLLTQGRPRRRRAVSQAAGSALSRAWSRTTPAAGSPRRRVPTTSPTSPSGRPSTGSTSPRPRKSTSRRCAARSSRSPGGSRPG